MSNQLNSMEWKGIRALFSQVLSEMLKTSFSTKHFNQAPKMAHFDIVGFVMSHHNPIITVAVY